MKILTQNPQAPDFVVNTGNESIVFIDACFEFALLLYDLGYYGFGLV
jgi:hypothetical protein